MKSQSNKSINKKNIWENKIIENILQKKLNIAYVDSIEW